MKKWSQYGTPWPLSEDDYLCVYDAAAANRGIYLIDRFGNRHLLYRDPEISCVNPIPLRPRPLPPVIPSGTVQTAEAREEQPDPPRGHHQCGQRVRKRFRMAAGNVESRRCASSRYCRRRPLLPTSRGLAWPSRPMLGPCWGRCRSSRMAVSILRRRSGKEIYFQALDEQGLAIQSMRSGTYVHPGEQLSCRGCHEPRREGPRNDSDAAGAAPCSLTDCAGCGWLESIQLRATGAGRVES